MPDRSNGPVAGVFGVSFFGTNTTAGEPTGTLYIFDNTMGNQLVPMPSVAAAPGSVRPPQPLPSIANPVIPDEPLRFYNNLEPGGMGAGDDSPHGRNGTPAGAMPGLMSIHHRRHRMQPKNTEIVPLFDDLPVRPAGLGSGLVVAAPMKPTLSQAGLAIWDFRPPVTDWALPASTFIAPSSPPVTATEQPLSEHIVSDVNAQISSTNFPAAFAYVLGFQAVGEYSDGGTPRPGGGLPEPRLRIVDVSQGLVNSSTSAPGATPVAPVVTDILLPSDGRRTVRATNSFSPYADKITIWPRRQAGQGPLPQQWVLVPMRDSVEIVNLAAPPALRTTVFVRPDPGYEIASNVSLFGEDQFIVLQRPNPMLDVQNPGAVSSTNVSTATQGARALVFDVTGARESVIFNLTSSVTGNLLDITRSSPDITVAPPGPNGEPETAWIPLWDSGHGGNLQYGVVASIANSGVGPGLYPDALPGTPPVVNDLSPAQFAVRYHGIQVGGPVPPGGPRFLPPLGAPSCVPPYDTAVSYPFGLARHPNFVAWMVGEENLNPATGPGPAGGSGVAQYGLAVIEAIGVASIRTPAFENVSGFLGPGTVLPPEQIYERPVWNYVNDTCGAVVNVPTGRFGLGAFDVRRQNPFVAPGTFAPLAIRAVNVTDPTVDKALKRQIATFQPPFATHQLLSRDFLCVAFFDVTAGLFDIPNTAMQAPASTLMDRSEPMSHAWNALCDASGPIDVSSGDPVGATVPVNPPPTPGFSNHPGPYPGSVGPMGDPLPGSVGSSDHPLYPGTSTALPSPFSFDAFSLVYNNPMTLLGASAFVAGGATYPLASSLIPFPTALQDYYRPASPGSTISAPDWLHQSGNMVPKFVLTTARIDDPASPGNALSVPAIQQLSLHIPDDGMQVPARGTGWRLHVDIHFSRLGNCLAVPAPSAISGSMDRTALAFDSDPTGEIEVPATEILVF